MSLNKVTLIGNVGKEPEIRYIDNGVAVARLSLATTDRAYSLPNGTQIPERTEWHNVILWRGLAETVEKYVHKGDKIYVEGPLRTRTFSDSKGNTKTIVEIWAEKMEMFFPKHNGGNPPRAEANTAQGTNEKDTNNEQPAKLPF